MSAHAQRTEDVPRRQRMMLPGTLLEPGGTRRSPRDWLIDATIVVLSVGIGAAVLVPTWDQHNTPEKVIDIVLGVIAIAALTPRRRHPMGVAVVTGVLSLVSGAAGFAPLAATFNAAIRGSVRSMVVGSVLSFAGGAVYPLLYPADGNSYFQGLLTGLVLTVLALVFGLFVRTQRELLASLSERAERAEADRRRNAEQAREAERRRIAYEMHDVLAHHMSLLSLHAGALEFRPDATHEEIAAAAGVIRASANSALAELRQVIGVLRDQEGQNPTAPPQPDLGDLPGLIAQARAAGMHVDYVFEVDDAAQAMSRTVGRTAFRVVQEGLTNARRHAPGAAVRVGLHTNGSAELAVEVASRPPLRPVTEKPIPGAGAGLIGLTERVELAGGALEHGTDVSGDFVLRATVPWSES